MAVMLKRVERPRELKWFQAGAMLYGDWGTSKAYVLGIAFALSGHASWFFLGLMSILTALVGICYMVICRVYPDGGGVYSSVKHRSQNLAVIGALLSTVALGYYLRIIVVLYMQAPPEELEPPRARRWSATLSGALCAGFVLAMGLFPSLFLGLLGS